MVAVTQGGSPKNGQQEGTPKPLIIYYKGGNQTKIALQPSASKLVVKVLAPFHYQSDKALSWRYGPLIIPVHSGNTSNETVNDVIGVSGMIRSGRCYAPGLMGVGQEKESVKNTSIEIAKTQKKKKKTVALPPAKTNAPVTKAEAHEVLKFIKNSAYNVVE